ncbi:MAG: mechanosensitive ion channel [Muribaculaceae bacterium]|nr:mechanosensitive ion channel [Muribaculaceae bacterium]
MIQNLLDPTAIADSIGAKEAEIISTATNKDLSSISSLSMTDVVDKLIHNAIDFGIKIAIALIVFYIGKLLINKLYKITKAIMVKRSVELSLATFILSLLKITLFFLLIIIVIGILGIETSSFIAIFASAGVAIGMALSGTLQNFAGGVLILLIKPYKVGDFIEAQGYNGKVKEIQIFYTIINTIDNKSISVPNGSLSTGTINNFSKEKYRRVDWKIGISYGDDFEVAKKLVLEILKADKRVVKKYLEEENTVALPETISEDDTDGKKRNIISRIFYRHKVLNVKRKIEAFEEIKLHHEKIDCSPFVALGELADNSINIVIRAWTKSENYWDLYFSINEKIYVEFPKAGLSFPFPQLDVHLKQN